MHREALLKAVVLAANVLLVASLGVSWWLRTPGFQNSSFSGKRDSGLIVARTIENRTVFWSVPKIVPVTVQHRATRGWTSS